MTDHKNGNACLKLLRPANSVEELYFQAYEAGNGFHTIYCLTLCSSEPLEEPIVRKALLHLLRKVPTLRLYFRHHEGTLWACEMNHEDLDFEVREEADLLKVQVALLDERFRTAEGPLWLARLLPAIPKGGVTAEFSAAFPYHRSLFLSFHHSIADGHTNSLTVNLFLRILDDLIKDNPIDDHEQLGQFVKGDETYAKLMATTVQLKNDKEQLKLFQAINDEEKEMELLTIRAFNLQKVSQGFAKISIGDLDEEKTRKFFQKSKEEGVTINSSFTAMIMGSMVEMVKDSGIKEDIYHFRGLHAVNMRKYWTGDTSKALGMHSLTFTHVGTTPSAWQDNFWEYARSVHRNLMAKIKEDELMTQNALRFVDEKAPASKEFSCPFLEHDFVCTNIGNLDVLIPTQGDNVRLIHLMRSSKPLSCALLFFFHSFRGRFMFSCCYKNTLKTEVAETIVNNISETLKKVC